MFKQLKDRSELRAFLRGSDVDEVAKIVRESICSTEAPKMMDDILQAFTDSEACQLKRRKLIECTLKALGKAKVPTAHADAIINRIILDFPRCSKYQLVKLIDFCLNEMCMQEKNDGDELKCWKDLIPVLLEVLENEKCIVYMDAEVSGLEFKSLIVKTICNNRWNVNLLPSLAKMFGDMSLNKTDCQQALAALCRALPNLALEQVPPFVYQALRLCKYRNSTYLLDALKRYFELSYTTAVSSEDKDSIEEISVTSVKQIRDVESTVLYHVYQAAQLNHENIQDFLRYIKTVSCAPEYTLQPFVLAVLLSVSGIYEEQVFEILRNAIVSNTQEEETRQYSAWLRQLLLRPRNVSLIFEELIVSSNKDRHLVLKGLIRLAFTLTSADKKWKSNAVTTWNMGAEMLREVMKKRHETVATVLQELIEKIVSSGALRITTHYTDCLAYACRKLSVIILDHQIWIMALLDRLLFLPSALATQVLYSIFPLMHVSPNIRENLILMLRKALYRKGTSQRQMAVTGFLEMLKSSKIHSLGAVRPSQRGNTSAAVYALSSSSSSTLTQVTLERNSQHPRLFPEHDKALSYEILDILKKCLTYEFDVKLHLYDGFYDAVKKNPEITDSVLDMLLSHFDGYFETDENVLPPVKFDLCTNVHGLEVVLEEPIAELIFLMQKIYIGIESKTSTTFDKLLSILESLCRRMADTELIHLNLDDQTSLSDDLLKIQEKVQYLKSAISIYEALMAFGIGRVGTDSEEGARTMYRLFKGYTRSVDFITKSMKTKRGGEGGKSKGKGKNKKDKDTTNTTKKHGKQINIKLPNTIMDLDIIRKGLSFLYAQIPPRSSQNRDIARLRENYDFHCYILRTCKELLQRTISCMENYSQERRNRYISIYIEVGGLLFKYPLMDLKNTQNISEEAAVLVLECFKEISCSMCTRFSSDLPRFLSAILGTRHPAASGSTLSGIDSQLQNAIFSLKKNLEESLVEEESENAYSNKIPFLLIEVIEHFVRKMNFDKVNPEEVFDWIKNIARMEYIHNSVANKILELLLHLEEYTQEYGETLNEICLELCQNLGTIDKSDMVISKQYKIICEDIAVPTYNTLNSCLKEKLNNASSLLMRLKAEGITARASGTFGQTQSEEEEGQVREKERSLCRHLSYIIQMLHTLANTSIEPGPCTDFTFRNLQHLYHLLGNLTKYFYAKSSGLNAAYQTVKFIQVVKLAGKLLKSVFYNLVTYVEENQNSLHSKTDSHAQRNKVLKETKVIPRVVYEIEQFNKEILLLGKKTGVPLENYTKHSVTRDFRIKNPQLAEGLEKLDVSLIITQNSETARNETRQSNTDENGDASNGSAEDDRTPARKRRRKMSESSNTMATSPASSHSSSSSE